MKHFIKYHIIIIIFPLAFINGCSVTPNFSVENSILRKNLKPIDEYFKTYIFKTCDKNLTLNSYKTVLDSKVSGVYSNPMSTDCAHISFNEHEPESFYNDLYSRSQDKSGVSSIIYNLNKKTKWSKRKGEKNPNFQGFKQYLI